MIILAIIAALGLIGFGVLVGGMIRIGNPVTERPTPEHPTTATIIVLRPRMDRRV